MPKPENPVQMAVIGAPHGIKGELRVKTFTGDPLALGDYGPLFDRTGDPSRSPPSGRPTRSWWSDSRASAIATRPKRLLTPSFSSTVRRCPTAVDDGEFYHADLIGLDVRDETGATVGKVTAVQNFGGGDILELSLGGRKGVLIPFTQAAVPDVDIAAGFIRIDTIAAGLVDDEDGGGIPDQEGRPGKGGLNSRPRGPKDAGGNR